MFKIGRKTGDNGRGNLSGGSPAITPSRYEASGNTPNEGSLKFGGAIIINNTGISRTAISPTVQNMLPWFTGY